MKICCNCKKEQELEEFHKNKNMEDGLQRVCKNCKSLYHKAYFAKDPQRYSDKNRAKRKMWLDFTRDLKSTGCSKCEENDPCCIDFHHINPSLKEFNVSKITKSSFNEINRQKVLDEVEKCILVCSNCHRKIHAV